MLSTTEIRQIIEAGFTPLSCRCELTSNGALTVEIYDADSGQVHLFVTGIALTDVQTSRQIAQVVGELRTEVELAQFHGTRDRQTRSI